MPQMINLLNSIPKVPVDNSLFAPKNTRKIAIAVSILFLLYISDAIIERIAAGRAFDKANAEFILAQDVLSDVNAKYPDPKKSVIETRGKDIEKQISMKRDMLGYLKGDTLSSHGYTPFLEALSSNIMPGVWLTLIDIDMSSNFVGLKGMSVSGPLIIKFVDQLSKDKIFQQMKMGLFKMEKTESKNAYVEFKLSNQVEREPGGPHEEPQ